MSEELLPCPFCGGEAEIKTLNVPRVGCSAELCRGNNRFDDWGNMPDAIKAWNTRTQPLIPSDDRHAVMFRSDKGCPKA